MCNDGSSLEEQAIQKLYGCWRDLYLWVWQAYDLTDDSWDPAGKLDACNVGMPFGKVVNSAFLLGYCLTDNYSTQWHSTDDYENAVLARDNEYHDDFERVFIQYSGSAEASTDSDTTEMHCPLFNIGSISDSVGNRAGVMVHEAWHLWQRKHDFDHSHNSGCSNGDCDWYYFHTVSAFDFGAFAGYDTDPAHLRFHSPYQVCAEFEADVAECSQARVPTVVTQMARNLGNTRLASCFKNKVGYRIGDPRPW